MDIKKAKEYGLSDWYTNEDVEEIFKNANGLEVLKAFIKVSFDEKYDEMTNTITSMYEELLKK